MKKYFIFDQDPTPQGLPLRRLLLRVREFACTGACQFYVRRSQGYGATVCRWNDLLDRADEFEISAEELERLSFGTEEWFYNLDVKCVTPTETIRFGLHDSSALFIEASPTLAAKIIREFSDVRSSPED
jgi:hypothetical protein